ncbi:MAG: OFA family MFS transporter [Vicinamibacterales bacterium]
MAQHNETPLDTRWHVLLGASLFNIAIGSYYAWSVFVRPLQTEFGWTRLETTSVASVNMAMLAILYNVAGTVIGRFGARRIAIFGGLCFSSGMLLASFTQSLLGLYLSAGLLVGIGLGFGYLPPLYVAFKWYPEARGLVSGLAVGIFAMGAGIVGPLAGGLLGWKGLIALMGWRHTFQVLAAVYFTFTMIGAIWLNDPPAHFVAPKPKEGGTAPKVSKINLTTGQMLRLPSFWILWVAYMFGCFSGTMTVSQIKPFADLAFPAVAGVASVVAALAIPMNSAGSAVGRFLSGWMSDHLGRLLTVRAVLIAAFFAAPLMYALQGSALFFFIMLFVVNYAYGTQLSVYTALAGDFYGPKHSAANYGILLLAWGTAGIFGPLVGGWVFDTYKSYQYAFYAAAAASAISLALLSIARPPSQEELDALAVPSPESGPAPSRQRATANA